MIDPKHVTLAKLLDGRLFRIPQYQRAYSWTSRQRADLFGDIDEVIRRGGETSHFMATIVVLAREKRSIIADEFQVVDVVDGQQRLTTLILLFRALAKALDQEGTPARLRAKLDELLVKGDEVSLLLLQTNHDTSNVFKDYLREGKSPAADQLPKTRAEAELRAAISDCEAYVGRFEPEALLTLAGTLRNRLSFIVHTLVDESVVYTVFEVLNSRGLSVAWIDRLKSMLMAIAFESGDPDGEHVAELHAIWQDIYRKLGIRQGMSDEALRFAAVLLTGERDRGRVLSSANAADAIRRWCDGKTKNAIQASRWLSDVVDALNKLNEQSVLTSLVRISQARFLAVSIQLSALSADDKARCLGQWEKTVFRVFGIEGKDSRTLSGQLVRLGIRVYQGKSDANATCADLVYRAKRSVVGTVREGLWNEDCYNNWRNELRYLLYRYEQHLAAEAGETVDATTWAKIWATRADDTIEHIVPQSKADDEGFASGRLFVHRLGNLAILPPGKNSSLQDKPFKKKQPTYATSPLHHVREVAGAAKWNKKVVKEREEKIIAWAESEFGP